jgi:hypothetical protein
MIRFKRSEYNSVLKDDSTYSGRTEESPTPLFLDAETESFVMWSGEGDIPEVGDKVDMRVPVRYQGVVKSHFFSYGYVGVKVLPYPQHHEELRKQGYGQLPKVGERWTVKDLVHNYGVDLHERHLPQRSK